MKVDFENFSLEQRILLLSATSWISQDDKDAVESLLSQDNFSWQKIFSEAKEHNIVSLLYANFRKIEAEFIDEAILLNIEGYYKSVKFINTQLISELSELQNQFNKRGIKVIVLKGLALITTIYDDIGLRYIGDIDLFAKTADWHGIEEVLRSQGYVPDRNYNLLEPTELSDYTLSFRSVGFVKREPLSINIDLHFNPIHIGNIEDTDLWTKTTAIHQADAKIHCLCPEHQLAHLCVHMNHHGYIILKWFVDIYALLHKYKSVLDWDYIVKKFRNTGTGVSIYYGLMLTIGLFRGCSVPDWVLNRLEPSIIAKKLFECTWDTQEISPINSENARHLNFRMTMMLTEKLRDKYMYIKNSVIPPLRWLRCRYNETSSKAGYGLYLSHFRDLIRNEL